MEHSAATAVPALHATSGRPAATTGRASRDGPREHVHVQDRNFVRAFTSDYRVIQSPSTPGPGYSARVHQAGRCDVTAGPRCGPGRTAPSRRRSVTQPPHAGSECGRPAAVDPRGQRRPARRLPADARRARRAGRGDRVQRRARRRHRGEPGEAAQGPVLHRLLRHPRRRLRGRGAGAPARAHARAHPPAGRRARRHRQPRSRAGRLQRLRRPRLPGHGAVRRRPRPGRHPHQRHPSSSTSARSPRSAPSAASPSG